MIETRDCSGCDDPYPLSEFPKGTRRCRKCRVKATMDWKRKNPEKVLANNLRHKRTHRENSRWAHIRKKYGLTREAFEQKLLEQEGCCAVCSKVLGSDVAVDHDHLTGQVRGLLCKKCNSGLGYFQESVEALSRAITYLTLWKGSLTSSLARGTAIDSSNGGELVSTPDL